MTELAALFLDNLLPIFLVAGAGYPLARYLHVDPKPLSQVIFYVFSPCLIFILITETELENADILRMLAFAAVIMTSVGLLTWVIGRLMRLERRLMSAVLLSSMLMNAGNFGMPVNLFAFGETALAFAGLYFISMAILTYTVGVVIASMGSSGLLKSLMGLFRLPTIYALIFGLIFKNYGLTLPFPAERAVNLLSDATIPSMLLLLGLQFNKVEWKGQTPAVLLASSMRLVIAPILAAFLSLAFGLDGAARQAGILESAMPTAVLSIILATEYEIEAPFVTTVVFVTTLVSPFTLTPLLKFLSA